MKVLLFCMAFAAVTLAMPVAEEKSELPSEPTPVAAPKAAETEPQVVAEPVLIEEKIPEPTPETKDSKLPEPEGKSVLVESEKTKAEEPKSEKVGEVKLDENAPEVKTAVLESETKLDSVPAESKSEDNPEEDKLTPEVSPKSDETPAIVNEVSNDVSAKSAMPDDTIDVLSAIKPDAAVADDVVDPAGIIPTPEKKTDLPITIGKDAELAPETKSNESPAAVPEAVKIDEDKPVELKAEEKPAEAIPATIPAVAPKSADADDDSLRVVRDTVDDKPKETKVEAPKEELKAAVPSEQTPKEAEKKDETVKEEKSIEPAKDLLKEAPAPAEPAAPADLPQPDAVTPEKMLGDAPVANSSEESSEEKKEDSAEKDSSSAESSEVSEKKESGAPKS